MPWNMWQIVVFRAPLIAVRFGKANSGKCRAIKSDSKFGIMLITATVWPANAVFIELANCKTELN